MWATTLAPALPVVDGPATDFASGVALPHVIDDGFVALGACHRPTLDAARALVLLIHRQARGPTASRERRAMGRDISARRRAPRTPAP